MISLVMIAVLPGFCEEVTHRGLLVNGFAPRIGVMRAVMMSAILFGLMHMNIIQCFYAAILGYFMALAMLATRSIWTPIIIHFTNNAMGTYLTYAGAYGWFGGDVLTRLFDFLGGMATIFILAFFIILYFVIVAIIHKFSRENYIKDRRHSEQGPILYRGGGMGAIRYYLMGGVVTKRDPLRPLEKTLIYGIVFLGVVITGMTLVWGFL